jgi:RimJ/RimL family protein N-acetyltransferase
VDVPILHTERLILRGYRPGDFEAFAVRRADPDFMRFMGDGVAGSEETSWASFLQIAGLWAIAGFGEWAVEEKQTGLLIGGAGFADRKRDRGPALKDVLEIGYAVATASAGKGYTTEAVRAALEWGRTHFGPRRCVAIIAPGNDASVRVATKCGFARGEDVVSAGRPRMVYERVL